MGKEDDDMRETQATPSRRKFWWSHQVAVSNITHLDIFYGSCTGTAQALATELAQKAGKRGVVVSLKEMNEFDPTRLDEGEQGSYYSFARGSVFVISTHYAGPAPNAEVFVEWLRQATEPSKGPTADFTAADASDSPGKVNGVVPGSPTKNNRVSPATSPTLQHPASSHSTFNWRHLFGGSGDIAKNKRKRSYARLQFAVFGVGNSTYLTYNAMGKLVDSRLHALGAVRLCPLGLGDVSNDISSTFSTWESKLLQKLAQFSTELGDSVSAMPTTTRNNTPRPLLSAGSAAQLTTPRRSSGPILATQSQGRRQRRNSILRRSSSASARSTGRQDRSIREHAEPQPATPLALTVLDFNGRPVSLRFHCRFLSSECADETRKASSNSFLPETNSPAEGGRRTSESWFSLKSLTMLPHPGSEDSNRLALLRLSIEDPMVNFEAADSFGFFPPNAPEIVDDIARQLGFDLEAYVEVLVQAKDPESPSATTVEPTSDSLPFPSVCTVRSMLRNFLELHTVSREFVRLASDFVTVPKERDLLENLASTDGAAAFRQHFRIATGGVLKLLELAPSLRIPFEVLINIAPLIKPRFHPIATAPHRNSREFDVMVPLETQDDSNGLVASNWQHLLAIPAAAEQLRGNNVFAPSTPPLRGFFSESGFTIPADRTAPMIMIAEGLGLAPFRSLIQQLHLEETSRTANISNLLGRQQHGKLVLFVGCPNKDSLLFETELLELDKKGALEVHVAFSADPDLPKQLVQDIVDQNWQQISTLMQNSGDSRLYVCGNATMVKNVHDLVASHCEQSGNEWYEAVTQSCRYVRTVIS